MNQVQPAIGQWYLRRDTAQKFEVIDLDGGDGMIEVQDEEGTLDEIDVDTWSSLALELTTQPQGLALFDNVAIPDEADGGDPVDLNIADTEPSRVADEELMNSAEDDDGGWDKGMEVLSYASEERETRH